MPIAPSAQRGRHSSHPDDTGNRPRDSGGGRPQGPEELRAVHGDVRSPSRTRRLAVVLAACAASYAAYRFYYAFGGRIGMVGRPAPAAHFRHDNLVGAIIILSAAVLPPLALSVWRHAPVRAAVATAGWVAAVGCCMHALTLETIRVLSLTGVRPTHYPSGFWLSINRHQADLQDALFNEPWFFVTGLLCAMFALTAVRPTMRRRWRGSAAVATLLAVVVGVLSSLGVIPTFRS